MKYNLKHMIFAPTVFAVLFVCFLCGNSQAQDASFGSGTSNFYGTVSLNTVAISSGQPPTVTDYQMINLSTHVKTYTYQSGFPGAIMKDYDNLWNGTSHDPAVDEKSAWMFTGL